MTLPYKFNTKTLLRCVIPAAAGLILSSSNMHANQAFNDGIGYREARFAEISAMREYRQCRDDALNLDTQARKEGSSARYLSSARLIEKCEAEVAASAAKAGENERMRAYALGIQNYFKGGDIAKAQKILKISNFKMIKFPKIIEMFFYHSSLQFKTIRMPSHQMSPTDIFC